MSHNTRRTQIDPQGRHVSKVSLDTNASGIAESTISLGLSRFPEPPASIPTTPLLSNFESSSEAVDATFNQPALASIGPLRRRAQETPSNPPTSFTRYAHPSPSFKPTNRPSIQAPNTQQPSTANLSPFDWHDGASSIDVDAAEDRLLPTSFITSLLQENRKNIRTSYSSDGFSGISEMTYPPLSSQSANLSTRNSSGKILPNHSSQNARSPPSSFPRATHSSNRMSDDSNTLHSSQGYPFSLKINHISQPAHGLGVSKGGVSYHTRSMSASSSQISSIHDSDTLRSNEKGYDSHKLSTTYETGDELLVDYKTYSPTYSPALPSTAGTQGRFGRDRSFQSHRGRNSMHSNKSGSPSLISRLSGLSLRRVLPWRVKPLPPVPLIPPVPFIATETALRKVEETRPLPDLISRAGALHDLLDRGQHPHHSVSTHYEALDPSNERHDVTVKKPGFSDSFSLAVKRASQLHNNDSSSNHPRSPPSNNIWTRKRWLCTLFSVILVLALVAIGAGVGIALRRNKQPQFNCSGNFTGAGCSLDASCVCTSTNRCNGLAQAIINIVPIVNQEFQTNISSATAYTDIWMMQGTSTTNTCASQALLIDVGGELDQTAYPNRTQWAQAALLWNAMQTQDTDLSQKMKKIVQSLPWKTLNDRDGPVDTENSTFSTTVAGFTYNFAAQTVTELPASFVTAGQPTNAQISRVSTGAHLALDRMYTFAQASATQQATALKKYWVSVLLQRPADLAVFKAALSIAPVMLPFDATSAPIRELYTLSPSSPFPPPLSCFPGLSSATLQRINSVETTIFGLQTAVSPTQFNPACYRDRPIYGILDVLRLRLPFANDQTGVIRQAAVLTPDATPRVVVYNGDFMSNMVNTAETTTTLPASQLDPRQYGTMNLVDHVILRYLLSITDVSVATALVRFVLDTVTKVAVPPDNSSVLFQSLGSLPILGVAVFGDVPPSDLTSTVSSFENPSGSLFFGSDDGTALRNWTINAIGGPVVWTQNATSSLVVRDNSLGDTPITQTWNAISLAISHNISGIGLPNITSTFQKTNNFSP